MKYPALQTFEQLLPQFDDFDAVIDVRSPSEFAEDHIPGAINCPVLDDAQRKLIGTMYAQAGSFEAKKAGAALVARNIAAHIESRFLHMPRDWRPLVYCWRGGNRSGAMAHVMAKIGWPVTQLDAGYKSYRQHVVASLAELPARFSFRVVCGITGSGKSRLLQTLAEQGAQVLDLERLAAHRGSVLGFLPGTAQPSQKAFESGIWQTLRRVDPARPVFVEAESKKVGNLRVPEALMEKMRASACISLSLPQPSRVRLLMRDYAHFVADPAGLNATLDCLLQMHGRETIARWHGMANAGQMEALVDELLCRHYDPSYLRSISRNFAQFAQALQIDLADDSGDSFQLAAQRLLAA
jgi:tRNA 2-selenouridine synthase